MIKIEISSTKKENKSSKLKSKGNLDKLDTGLLELDYPKTQKNRRQSVFVTTKSGSSSVRDFKEKIGRRMTIQALPSVDKRRPSGIETEREI